MGERIPAFDWSRTPIGPITGWPPSLRTAVQLMLCNRYPMFVWWGSNLTNLYNDAYIPILGQRHPAALGMPASEIWSDVWDVVGPQTEDVMNAGKSSWNEERMLITDRNGFIEETYFTFSYSPIPDEHGAVGGLLGVCTEETHRVLNQRRLRS